MKVWLTRTNFYVGIVSGFVTLITALLGALSFNKNLALWIFLIWLAMFSLLLLLVIFLQFNRYIKRTSIDPYDTKFSYISYTGFTRETGGFEAVRFIQGKRSFQQKLAMEFKWNGDPKPAVYSDLQKVLTPIRYGETERDIDVVDLLLDRPLYYNEVTVVHLRLELKDTYHKAWPVLIARMKEYSKPVYFCCDLRYKQNLSPAVLERKKEGTNLLDNNWEFIKHVQPTAGRYIYILNDGEPGYHYSLRWEW